MNYKYILYQSNTYLILIKFIGNFSYFKNKSKFLFYIFYITSRLFYPKI